MVLSYLLYKYIYRVPTLNSNNQNCNTINGIGYSSLSNSLCNNDDKQRLRLSHQCNIVLKYEQ